MQTYKKDLFQGPFCSIKEVNLNLLFGGPETSSGRKLTLSVFLYRI
jgi:hypothetical protein